jgi:hypothetical protein
MEEIGDYCFNSRESLREIRIENDSRLKRIGNDAFMETGIERFHRNVDS